MQEFDIVPKSGFGPILLGKSQEWCRGALHSVGLPIVRSRRFNDSISDGCISLEYDCSWNLQYIGIGCSSQFIARYGATDVFDLPAPELFDMVASRDHTGDHNYDPVSYTFRGQIVALGDADKQYDRRREETRPIYCTFGIGNEVYLDAIDEVKKGRGSRLEQSNGSKTIEDSKPCPKCGKALRTARAMMCFKCGWNGRV